MKIFVDGDQRTVTVQWGSRGAFTVLHDDDTVTGRFSPPWGAPVYDSVDLEIEVEAFDEEAGELDDAVGRIQEFLAVNSGEKVAFADPLESIEYRDGAGVGLAVLNTADIERLVVEYVRLTGTRRKAAA